MYESPPEAGNFELESVSVSQNLPRGTILWPSSFAMVGPFAALIACALLAQPLIVLLTRFGLPGWTGWMIVGVAIAAFFGIGVPIFMSRGKVPREARGTRSRIADPWTAGRLTLFGQPAEVDPVLSLASKDEAFEPLIIRSWFNHQFFRLRQDPATQTTSVDFRTADLAPRSYRVVYVLSVVALLGLVVLLKFKLGSLDGRKFPEVYEIFGALAGGRLIAGWIRPSYIRIAPGQLDVLQWSFLGMGKPACRSFDLRKAELIVMPASRAARIRLDGGDLPCLGLRWFPDVIDGRNVAASLLQAARTRYPTPPLSMDSLV